MLANILSQFWWMTLLRGVIWILFGTIIFMAPGISLVALAVTFGVFALIDGIGNVVSAIGGRHESERWWVLLLGGLCGIAVGVLTFLNPGMTAYVLLIYLAVWAIFTGIFQVVAAIRLRKEIEGELWLMLLGVLSIAFGLLLIARPGAGALSVLWLIAGYAIAFGVLLIVLAFKVRGFLNRVGARIKA